jgi:hypothetical protein
MSCYEAARLKSRRAGEQKSRREGEQEQDSSRALGEVAAQEGVARITALSLPIYPRVRRFGALASESGLGSELQSSTTAVCYAVGRCW